MIGNEKDGNKDDATRRVGKRVVWRNLFLRITFGTVLLTGAVVGSAYIVDHAPQYADLSVEERMYKMRATSFNVLDYGAMSIMMSVRFSYLSSFHLRVLSGNAAALDSCAIVAVVSLLTPDTPGLNSVVFGMKGKDGLGWGNTLGM